MIMNLWMLFCCSGVVCVVLVSVKWVLVFLILVISIGCDVLFMCDFCWYWCLCW